MSTETFARILWVVLDGFGHEHARRLLEAPGRLPALERIAREGFLGPSRPPGPVCETPPALLALFTGTEPAENGVWGYKVPDADGRLERTISGFSVARKAGTSIWEDLEASGRTFSLMNVAFRRDRVWSDPFPHLAFAYDGYRSLRFPSNYDLPVGRSRIDFDGIQVEVDRRSDRVELRRGARLLARLAPGGAGPVRLTRAPGRGRTCWRRTRSPCTPRVQPWCGSAPRRRAASGGRRARGDAATWRRSAGRAASTTARATGNG